MDLLSNYQLRLCRETLNRSLPDKAEIERRTKTPDGKGGFSSTWAVIATPRCRVGSPDQETELESGGSTRAQSEYMITLPWNTDCQPQDRILVNGVRRYEVIQPPPANSYAVDLRFKVKLL